VQLLGPGGSEHAVTALHQQRIGERLPQTVQHVADRRLTHMQLLGSAGNAAREHQRIKGHQQVDIERSQRVGHRR